MKFILTSLTFLALIASSTQAAKENPKKLTPILGDDLSGWKVPAGNDKANWYTVKDGVLVIQSGPKKKGSVLWTEKKFKISRHAMMMASDQDNKDILETECPYGEAVEIKNRAKTQKSLE